MTAGGIAPGTFVAGKARTNRFIQSWPLPPPPPPKGSDPFGGSKRVRQG